jgi:hypothetical protein
MLEGGADLSSPERWPPWLWKGALLGVVVEILFLMRNEWRALSLHWRRDSSAEVADGVGDVGGAGDEKLRRRRGRKRKD